MLVVNLSLDKSSLNAYLSSTLISKIEENLKKNKKTILYLNKRWEFSSLICQDCQYIYKCPNCDISLSVHKNPEKLACHLCWYNSSIPLTCEKCNWTHLIKIWVWTQQIEASLKSYFKDIDIFRFDLDQVKNISEKKEALKNLENSQIIIWTKMITTGFDIQKVGLIWIILFEQELNIPDYNTEERAYTNIKQILGRGWRAWEKTEFIVQSFIADNDIIKTILESNYKDFFKHSLTERKLFNYPPFCEMAYLEYRDTSKTKANDFIVNLKNKLDLLNSGNFEIILNESPRKKYNQYYYKIIVKSPCHPELDSGSLRSFLNNIKPEIMRNSKLNLIFE